MVRTGGSVSLTTVRRSGLAGVGTVRPPLPSASTAETAMRWGPSGEKLSAPLHVPESGEPSRRVSATGSTPPRAVIEATPAASSVAVTTSWIVPPTTAPSAGPISDRFGGCPSTTRKRPAAASSETPSWVATRETW